MAKSSKLVAAKRGRVLLVRRRRDGLWMFPGGRKRQREDEKDCIKREIREELPKLKLGATLAKKKLGFRYLMDVIPLDASLVKGSHGRPPASPQDAPVFISRDRSALGRDSIAATDVCDLLLEHLGAPIGTPPPVPALV